MRRIRSAHANRTDPQRPFPCREMHPPILSHSLFSGLGMSRRLPPLEGFETFSQCHNKRRCFFNWDLHRTGIASPKESEEPFRTRLQQDSSPKSRTGSKDQFPKVVVREDSILPLPIAPSRRVCGPGSEQRIHSRGGVQY